MVLKAEQNKYRISRGLIVFAERELYNGILNGNTIMHIDLP